MTAEANGKAAEAPADAGGADDEEIKNRKRRERLEQNRVSARESRKRKKTMIEELQRTVITLSRENKELNDRNEQLRRQLMEIGAKYPSIVPLQAIMQGGAAGQVPPTAGDPNAAAAAAAAQALQPVAAASQPQAAPAPAMVAFPQMTFWPAQQQAGAPQAAQPAAGVPQSPQQQAAVAAPPVATVQQPGAVPGQNPTQTS